MTTGKHIRNMDELEKEIYRLRLRRLQLEKQLNENIEYLQHHYASMAMHSVFSRGAKEKADENAHSAIRGKLGRVLDHVVDHLVDRAADGIERVVNQVFHKKEEKK